MSLSLDKCGDDWDWYALHRNGANIQWASIEGDADEWRQVADAIEKFESISFKRVSFVKDGNMWLVSSPRNSMAPTLISTIEVRDLVPVIRAAIAEGQSTKSFANHDENRETE